MSASMKMKAALVPAVVFVGVGFVGYGCKQVIGWEEPVLREPKKDGGGIGGAGGSGGGVGGAGGSGGGGVAGSGGAGGSGGSPECTIAGDCPGGSHGAATCVGGVCGFVCDAGFDDCDGVMGCETNLVGNRDHCGACGTKCVAQCKGMSCNDPVSVAGGYQHNCAVLKDGQVYCWGRNEKGELGDGTLGSKLVPTKVNLPAGVVAVQVDGGGSFGGTYSARTCAVLTDGKFACWGDGVKTPAVISLPLMATAKKISIGDRHNCIIDSGNALWCWGFNLDGQVGNGNTTSVATPVKVSAGVLQVSAGRSHTCAVKVGGGLECWGDNGKGQLGIGSMTSMYAPTPVPTLALVDEVQSGDEHTCSRGATGFYCWGSNSLGQLGIGSMFDKSTPQPITIAISTSISLGYGATGAIAAGSLWMWGNNTNGKLGNNSQVSVLKPVQLNLTDVSGIALAGTSSCAVTGTGNVYCWGDNTYGQLGNGTIVNSFVPKLVVWP